MKYLQAWATQLGLYKIRKPLPLLTLLELVLYQYFIASFALGKSGVFAQSRKASVNFVL